MKHIYLRLVYLSICQQDYLQSNERIYIEPSPEVYVGPRSNQLNVADGLDYDPEYDPDLEFKKKICVLGKETIHQIVGMIRITIRIAQRRLLFMLYEIWMKNNFQINFIGKLYDIYFT